MICTMFPCGPRGLDQLSVWAAGLSQSSSEQTLQQEDRVVILVVLRDVVTVDRSCSKPQTSVSHSSTESEIISLDAGLRLDGIPAFDLWDLIFFVLGNTIQTPDRSGQPVVNGNKDHGPKKRSQGMINVLNSIDCVPSNV